MVFTSFALLLLTVPAILRLLAVPCEAMSILYFGDTLYAGEALAYRSYSFVMQNDCNLVLYDEGYAVWATNTYDRGHDCFLRLEHDGNLVVYADGGDYHVWESNTNRGHGHYICVLQRDRNVVIYGRPLWATGTNFPGVHIADGQNATSTPTAAALANKSATSAAEGEEVIISNRKIAMVTN